MISYPEMLDIIRSMTRKDELFYFFLRACESGNLQLCQTCLDAGADINITEHYYNSSLFRVFCESPKFTIKVADWLIDKGVNLEINGYRCSPLSYACSEGNLELAKYFYKKGVKISKKYDVLYAAICSGNPKMVKWLLDLNVINITPKYLVTAIEKGDFNITKILLEKGISPNFYYHCKTPLHVAIIQKRRAIACLLLEHNAFVNAPLEKGNSVKTPMDIAVSNNDTNMQALLLEFGGSISSK